jgi:hypothetical protein
MAWLTVEGKDDEEDYMGVAKCIANLIEESTLLVA